MQTGSDKRALTRTRRECARTWNARLGCPINNGRRDMALTIGEEYERVNFLSNTAVANRNARRDPCKHTPHALRKPDCI